MFKYFISTHEFNVRVPRLLIKNQNIFANNFVFTKIFEF